MSDAGAPPVPDGLPVLGNSVAFSRDPWSALETWADLDDVVRVSFPGRRLYLVTHPDLIREVLVERHDAFTISADQRETFADVEDDAITGTTGDRWRRLRRALQPAFTAERIAGYGRTIAERTVDEVEGWPSEPVDVHRRFRLLTVNVLGDTLLGVDLTGDEAVVMDAADALIDRSDPRRVGRLLPDPIPTPTERRFHRHISRLDAFVEDVLADASTDGTDVRSVLVDAHERGGLSRAELKDNLVAVMLAGHDSSAAALSYLWYELSNHPGVLERVRNEVADVCGGELPTGDHFDDLEYTRATVDETVRLYPPAWATPRETTEPIELGGYRLPEGSQVMCPQWVLHRDDRFWDDPERFDPSRWRDDADRPEYAYFPFSGGPRHCLGMRFARFELTTVLAAMAPRYDLSVTAEGKLDFRPALTLRPTVRLEGRLDRREGG